jgi:hypothetical protein
MTRENALALGMIVGFLIGVVLTGLIWLAAAEHGQ